MRASPNRAFADLWRGLYAAMPNADYERAVALPSNLQATGLVEIDMAGSVDLVRGATDVAQLRPAEVGGAEGGIGVGEAGHRWAPSESIPGASLTSALVYKSCGGTSGVSRRTALRYLATAPAS